MSAAETLRAARLTGITFDIHGGDLELNAAAPPPTMLIDLLRHHKTGILELLRRERVDWTQQDWEAFFQERAAIIEHDGGFYRATASLNAFEETVDHWLAINPPVSASDKYCVKMRRGGAA